MNKWQQRWVNMAHSVSEWSKDPNTKIGVVLVNDDRKQILSVGFNGIPRGVDDKPEERSSRENGEKYYWYAHAERNAIYNCAYFGLSPAGATMYMACGMPCTDCAIAIIQAGVKEILIKDTPPTGEPNSKWDAHATRSRIMLTEAGVNVIVY